MAKILVVGLNPAWQKVIGFADFRPGEVNRAAAADSLASGKGINTAKVLRRLGHEVTLLHILGGENGRKCQAGCEALGIRSLPIWVASETRECLTLLPEGKETTEIILPFRVGEPGVRQALLDALPAAPGDFAALAICGTVPPGAGDGIYAAILDRVQARISVLDAWQGLDRATVAKATWLKMNRSEYLALGQALASEGTAAPMGSASGPIAGRFLLTAGADEAEVRVDGRRIAGIAPPRLASVVNPIGAGDTVTAGVVHHLLAGLDGAEAFRHGLAMGSASCLDRLPAEYREQDAADLLPQCRLLP